MLGIQIYKWIYGKRKEVKKERGRKKKKNAGVVCLVFGIGMELPAGGTPQAKASRRDRCGIKKTCRGRVFLMALDPRLGILFEIPL